MHTRRDDDDNDNEEVFIPLTPLRAMPHASLQGGERDGPAQQQLSPAYTSVNLPTPGSTSLYRLRASFFLLGLLNNSLYVVILTAALELLPAGVPTGTVALANIAPALVAKAIWPYLLKGEVRYLKRTASCALLSWVGMVIIALFPSLELRLLGISMASFSSGLGELTFLQLSTRYGPWAGEGVGWFASGTGAAGLVGASAWWIVRPWGIKIGLSVLSLLPWVMLAVYGLLLPSREKLEEGLSTAGYAPVTTDDGGETIFDGDGEQDGEGDVEQETSVQERLLDMPVAPDTPVKLSFAHKMSLLRPMLFTFIAPLVLVYTFEYTINQGVAPTLLYPLPSSSNHPLLALIIKKFSDYYPLYQLTYQIFVFISRSSISILHLPAIPTSWLWAPALLQGTLLALLITESLHNWFRASIASPLVIVLICCEGLAGGAAYVSVFYQIGTMPSPVKLEAEVDSEASPSSRASTADREAVVRAQEREFRIGCVGVGDSAGILVAALVAMPLELGLCSAQVARGREYCRMTKT